MADLNTLGARLLVRLGLPSTDGMFPTGTVDQLINDGLRAMANDYDWPWLVTVGTLSATAGEETYSTSGITGWVRTLWIANGTTDLEYRQRRDLVKYAGLNGTGSSGLPLFYAISADSIILSPTPNQALTLQHAYVRAEPALVNGTDTPLCPDHFSDLILIYAGMEAATLLKDSTMYRLYRDQANDAIERMKDNMRRSASTVRPKARSDWSM